jgi:hypothetical protein
MIRFSYLKILEVENDCPQLAVIIHFHEYSHYQFNFTVPLCVCDVMKI